MPPNPALHLPGLDAPTSFAPASACELSCPRDLEGEAAGRAKLHPGWNQE